MLCPEIMFFFLYECKKYQRCFLYSLTKIFISSLISRVLEGGLASAAVLISLGAVLGKLNPFQVLLLSLIEAPLFVLNTYLGFTILGVVDVGEIINIITLNVIFWKYILIF